MSGAIITGTLEPHGGTWMIRTVTGLKEIDALLAPFIDKTVVIRIDETTLRPVRRKFVERERTPDA
jgi:hypothetical protein